MNLNTGNDDSIKIRCLVEDDFRYVLRWSKDNTFCSANGWEENRGEEALYNWWVRCINNIDKDFIRLGIESENQLIGYADLAYIKGNSAELGIAIGESSLWGKGIGFKSSLCMIDYAYNHLGLTLFNAETHENNTRARRMLVKIGFKEISRIGTEEYLGIVNNLIQYQFSF